jgi:hypothetical protein
MLPAVAKSFSKAASRQAQLQRELGELGEVLPRMPRGEGIYRAAGWYAKLTDGKIFFLGDNSIVALQTIAKLHEKLGNRAEQEMFA